MHGVDSVAGPADTVAVARSVAQQRGAIVVITGATDVVTDGHRAFAVSNGHAYLEKLTGTGCSVTATISCFVGAHYAEERQQQGPRAAATSGDAPGPVPTKDPSIAELPGGVTGGASRYLPAVVTALAFFGVCAEKAAVQPGTQGPASFKVAFHDALATLTEEELVQGAQVKELP